MKKTLLLLFSLLIVFGGLVVSSVHVKAYTQSDYVDIYSGVLSVDKSPNGNYPISYGDSWDITIYNNTNCNITESDKSDTQTLTPGQQPLPYSFSNVTTQTTVNISSAPNTGCGSSGMDTYITVYPGQASLSCTTTSTTRTITGSYSNFVSHGAYFTTSSDPSANQNSINNSGSSGSVYEQFSSNGGTAQSYYLYNSVPSNPGNLVSTVNCPSYTAPPTGSTNTPSTTKSKSTTTPAVTTTTPPAAATTSKATSKSVPTTNYLYATNTNNKSKLGAFFYGYCVLIFLLTLILVISTWKVFVKAGRPGWAALIPFYSTWVILELGDKPGWWSLILLIPIVNIVALVMLIMALLKLGEKFGKSLTFSILGLVIFNFVGLPILAFSKSEYKKTSKIEASPKEST